MSENFNPQNLAQSLNKLSKNDIMRYKRQCHENSQILSSESNKNKILNIVDEVI